MEIIKEKLTDRTFLFSKQIVLFAQKFDKGLVNRPIILQLVRSATSIGANFMEADCAESDKDFVHKISICRKEAKETAYWLKLLAVANIQEEEKIVKLAKEAHELTLIFSSIWRHKCNK